MAPVTTTNLQIIVFVLLAIDTLNVKIMLKFRDLYAVCFDLK